MNYKTACEVLQVGPKPQMTIGHVLINFSSMIRSDNVPEDLSRPAFIRAKNLLLHKLIDEQVASMGKFEVNAPFDEPCPACYGTGEIYKFYRKTVIVDCRCDNGTFDAGKCWTCKGSGRFIKIDEKEPDLRYNYKCKRCVDGRRIVKCRYCNGRGKQTKFVIAKIESAKTCFKCRGIGFVLPKNLSFFNPLPIGNLERDLEPESSLADMISSEVAPPPIETASEFKPSAIPVRTIVTSVDDETERDIRSSV